jgi:PRC-barrel domain protein
MATATLQPELSGETPKPHGLIPSDRVEGTAVRRSNGEKVGEIKRLMIDKVSGKVAYAVMKFGGFLGMGENYHPLPWDTLKYNTTLEAYELNIPEAQLKGAPAYEMSADFDWGDRERERRLHEYYKVPPYWGV